MSYLCDTYYIEKLLPLSKYNVTAPKLSFSSPSIKGKLLVQVESAWNDKARGHCIFCVLYSITILYFIWTVVSYSLF